MKHLVTRGLEGVKYGTGNIIGRAFNKPLKPRWLFFATTDRCNSRCQHCNIWQQKSTADILKPAEVENILKAPVFQGIEFILNTGGEVTLRNDLEELFLAEHKALPNAQLQLSTNGLLPDRAINLVKFAMKNDICLNVGVSLDGVGKGHDIIRGIDGNFIKVERLLNELIEIRKQYPDKLSITIGYVLSALSLPLLPDLRKYLWEEFALKPFIQWYNESSFYKNTENAHAAKDDVIQVIQSISPDMLGGLQLKKMWLKWLKGQSIKFPCYAMDTFFVLKSNGDIVPCLTLWDNSAGNVRDNDPETVWRSAAATAARKCVKNCTGCLNSWGTDWSWQSSFFPYLYAYLSNPHELAKLLRRKE